MYIKKFAYGLRVHRYLCRIIIVSLLKYLYYVRTRSTWNIWEPLDFSLPIFSHDPELEVLQLRIVRRGANILVSERSFAFPHLFSVRNSIMILVSGQIDTL